MSNLANVNPNSEKFMSEEAYRTGKRLIGFAWAIEIFAASIGLLIAFLTAWTIRESLLNENQEIVAANWMSIFLGALPFFMVAIVEITKIPLATAAMHTRNWLWKTLFLLGLIFLMAITFETVLNGFERNFTTRTYAITQLRKNVAEIDDKIEKLQGDVSELEKITEDNLRHRYSEEVALIRQKRDEQLRDIDGELNREMETSSATDTDVLKSTIATINKDIENLRVERSEVLKGAEENSKAIFKERRNAVQAQLDDLEVKSQQLETRIEENRVQIDKIKKENSERGFFAKLSGKEQSTETLEKDRNRLLSEQKEIAEEIKKYRKNMNDMTTGDNSKKVAAIRAEFDNKIAALEKKRDSTANKIDKRIQRASSKSQPIIDGLKNRRERINSESSNELNKAQVRHEEALLKLQSKAVSAENVQGEVNALEEKRLNLKEQINLKAQDSQIFRIAALWAGKNTPSDVNNEELRVVSFVWFGSLAAIVAWTGTLLAFAGLVVKRGAYQNQAENKPWLAAEKEKAYRTWRRFNIERRRKAREPIIKLVPQVVTEVKEVVKEVPVDKVVFKEVPKEVVHKELVYVPLYTKDETLLDKRKPAVEETATIQGVMEEPDVAEVIVDETNEISGGDLNTSEKAPAA